MSAALAATVPPSAPASAQTSADRLSHLKRLEAVLLVEPTQPSPVAARR